MPLATHSPRSPFSQATMKEVQVLFIFFLAISALAKPNEEPSRLTRSLDEDLNLRFKRGYGAPARPVKPALGEHGIGGGIVAGGGIVPGGGIAPGVGLKPGLSGIGHGGVSGGIHPVPVGHEGISGGIGPVNGGILEAISPGHGIDPGHGIAGGGILPGHGGIGLGPGAVGSSATCRYWCKTPENQAYCCEGNNELPTLPFVKPGVCPPVRPQCPPVRNFGPPEPCSNDSKCAGVDKCCYDRCLEQHVCKPPQHSAGPSYGR
ncbi:elastin-like [Macrobrachium nipponense]|uniref:elastin-like n=1 Tax=Macrobrachium nipponense TaxID=159736 RepID=UPI0030C80DF7